MTGIGHIPGGQPWRTALPNSISLGFDFYPISSCLAMDWLDYTVTVCQKDRNS